MKQHDHPAFYELIGTWLRSRGQPGDPKVLGLWLVALQHLTLDEISEAVRKAMQDTEHGMKLPSPALVLRHVVKRPVYHVKERLPDIARSSDGLTPALDHLTDKQAGNPRGRAWIAKMREDLRRAKP